MNINQLKAYPLTFRTNNLERMRIDSSGRLLIATTDIGYSGFGDDLTIGSASGNNGMTIRSGTSNYGTFYFSDDTGTSAGTYAGKIQYNHSDNSMVFATNSASEKMRITSAGNVGIGTTSPPFLLSLSGNSQGMSFTDTSGGTNAKAWLMQGLDSDFRLRTQNDSYGGGQVATLISRTAEVVNNHQFYTEDSERMRLTSTGLGIGTTSPTAKLHVDTSNSGVTPNANADELFVENSGNAGITIGSGTGNAGQLCFGDSGDNDKGAIAYLHDVDAMRFTTNGTEKMRIDSSGNVGINTTNTQAKLHIVRTDVGALNDGNSNGIMIEDTNAGISIGSATTGEGHIYFSDSNDADVGAMSYFHNNNSLRFRANANERMRIDSSGNVGIGNTIPSDFNSQAENLVIGGGSGDAGMTIYSGSGTGDTGNIFFADGTSGSDPVRGGITYNHGDNSMNFRTNDGANRIYISSAGKVGIGTSSPSHALQVSDKFAVDTSNSFGRIYLGRPVSPNLSSIMIQGTDVGEASNTLSMINYSGVGMSIELDSSASAMVFNVSGASTERMRISGNTVMIGKTSNGIANDGVELKTNDVARFT